MIIPYGIGVKDWFASLLIDLQQYDIPILERDEDWKEIGDFIRLNIDISDIPSTYSYDKWNDWAYDFYYLMEQDNGVAEDGVSNVQ